MRKNIPSVMTKPKVLGLAAGAFLLSSTAWGQKPPPPEVPNLAQVEPGIWRGGQPTEQGWRDLRSLGITNVVKLNLESEGSDAAAERMGMKIFSAPITLPEQLGIKKASPQEIERVLTAVPAKGTFIHCEHGQDRTGLFVAIWRVQRDGWAKADAEKEMLAHGFHKDLKGLWLFWEDFQKSKDDFSQPPGAP
jgi:hypothetical protein